MRGYAVEDAVFADQSEPLPWADAEALAVKLLNHVGRPDVLVRRGAGDGSAWYVGSHTIRLGINRPAWLVCHEVAHAWCGASREGHGPLWARRYVALVRFAIGDPEADRLLAGFKAVRLLPPGTVA